MPLQVVTSGKEPLIREAVAYLERLGIPARNIRAVSIDGQVGQVLMLTVEMYVDASVDLSGDAEPLEDVAVKFQRRMTQMIMGPFGYGAQSALHEAIRQDRAEALADPRQAVPDAAD